MTTSQTFSVKNPVFSFSLSKELLQSGLISQIKKKVSEIRLKVRKNSSKLENIDFQSEQAKLFKENLEEKLERVKQTKTIHKTLENIEDFSKNSVFEVQQKLLVEAKKTEERVKEGDGLIRRIREKIKLAKREFEEISCVFKGLAAKEAEICSSVDFIRLERLRLIMEQNVLFRWKSEEEVRDLESKFAVKPEKKTALVIEVNLNEFS
jgi:hypothetical protein